MAMSRWTVTDQGQGDSSAASRARIFDRFYRSPSVQQQMPGSGLGLSIAQSIAQAHDGDLTVTSRPGETTFRLTLPVRCKGEKQLSAGRILVVDDEPQIRRIMRTTLTGAGYEVDDAKTGEEALEKVREFRPDLVLLDINMPGMGGLAACREMRADHERRDHHADGPQHREPTRWRRWTPAPTISSPSRSARRNCWRASARRCGAFRSRAVRRRRRSEVGRLTDRFRGANGHERRLRRST